MLPKKDGLSIIRDLRSNKIESILIIITVKDEEADILESFEAGAEYSILTIWMKILTIMHPSC